MTRLTVESQWHNTKERPCCFQQLQHLFAAGLGGLVLLLPGRSGEKLGPLIILFLSLPKRLENPKEMKRVGDEKPGASPARWTPSQSTVLGFFYCRHLLGSKGASITVCELLAIKLCPDMRDKSVDVILWFACLCCANCLSSSVCVLGLSRTCMCMLVHASTFIMTETTAAWLCQVLSLTYSYLFTTITVIYRENFPT